jgi:hypothetical protein
MAVEIATWGMGRLGYLAYRAAVVAALVAGGLAVAAVIAREGTLGDGISVGNGPFHGLLEVLVRLNDSVFSYVAWPFQPLLDLILADALTTSKLGHAAAALATLGAMAAGVIGLHAVMSRRVANREKRDYGRSDATRNMRTDQLRAEQDATRDGELVPPQRRIPRFGGAGTLAWRQLLGTRRYRGSLLVATIAPTVLASAPCFVISDPYIAFLSTTGTLAFYTFLLLPTALRFDFRRDLDRLATFKGLPITPGAAAIGQILAPVLLATLFQSGVLAIAVVARSLPAYYLIATLLVMIPLNLLVFGLDNLIYLLYPHRLQQEGLEIFLRTMLTFTGKGLLFAAGLVAMSAWGFAAAALTRGISRWTGSVVNAYAVFTAGMIAGTCFLAALVLRALCRTYGNVDPIEDVPR